MPVKRRTPKARTRITHEAVEAFRVGDRAALYTAINQRPWEPSPLDVDDGPSPWPAGSGGSIAWPEMQELRRDLLAATAAN